MFGFIVNFSKGETEAIVAYRGTNAAAHRREFQVSAKPAPPTIAEAQHLAVDASFGNTMHACIVPYYKHLGSIISYDG